MATNFGVKIGKIGLFTLFVALAFRNGLQYRHYGIQKSIYDDVATYTVCKYGELWSSNRSLIYAKMYTPTFLSLK